MNPMDEVLINEMDQMDTDDILDMCEDGEILDIILGEQGESEESVLNEEAEESIF